MYCRGCSYPLNFLPENRCPECGRDFDPADPKTFKKLQRRPWLKWFTLLFAVVLFLVAIDVGHKQYRAWQMRRFREARDVVRNIGGDLLAVDSFSEADTPERVDTVSLGDQFSSPLTTDTIRDLEPYLRRFPRFRLAIYGRKCEGNALSQLNGLRNIRELSADTLTDENLTGLANLSSLEAIALSGRGITDRGLAYLRDLAALQYVVALQTKVTPQAAHDFETSKPGTLVFLPYTPVRPPFTVKLDDDATIVTRVDPAGKLLWEDRLPQLTGADPVWNENVAVFSGESGCVALDMKTGRVLWRAAGRYGASCINKDTFVTADAQLPEQNGHPFMPPSLTGRNLLDGKLISTVRFPVDDMGSSYSVSPMGDGFLCHPPGNEWDSYFIDNAGHRQLHFHDKVAAGIPFASGWVLLTSDCFERIDSGGRSLWSSPLVQGSAGWGVISGEIVRLANGDIIGLAFNRSFEGTELVRISPQNGKVVWRAPVKWSEVHSAYSLDVHMQLRNDLVAVTCQDLYTTLRIFDVGTGRQIMSQSADSNNDAEILAH